MNARRLGIVVLALLTESVVAASPNVVLIVADDIGYGDLGSYGAPDTETPHIDRIGEEGVRFTRFYSNGPECTPTRVALLTGRYQQRVGGMECAIGTGNHGRYDDAIRLRKENQLGLPVEDAELPAAAEKQDYATAAIGKWHLGYEERFSPVAHGWDYSIGPLGGGVDYFHHTEPKGLFLGDDLPGEEMLYRQGKLVERDEYMTDLITNEAVAWLASVPRERPFFLYVPYTAPHTPLQGPNDRREEKMTGPEWNEGTRETYVEMVEAMDAGVGKILVALDDRGAAENTVVVFFSDNGPTKIGRTGGLRGTKGNVFEGGIRVPCLVRWPGKIASGTVCDEVAIGMDLTASLLRLCGSEPKRPLDGIDILAAVEEGKPLAPRPLFWRKRRGEVTVTAARQGDWKLVRQRDGADVAEHLFNLATDEGEEDDRIDGEPEQAEELKDLLLRWDAEVKARR